MHTSYWSGRSTRRGYWFAVAILAVLQLIVAVAPLPSGASIGMMVAWTLVFARRLHDFGRTGWWVAAMYGLQLAAVVAGVVIGGEGALALLLGGMGGREVVEAGGTAILVMLLAFLAALLAQVVFTIWLGVVRGDAGENRFGPPPAERRVKAAA